MRVNNNTARGFLEACEVVGVPRAKLLAGFRFDVERPDLDWEAFAALLDRAAMLLDGDVERIRSIGAAMIVAPSWPLAQVLARTVVSLRSLCELGARWVAPANFPHIPLEQVFVSDNRFRTRSAIMTPHAACATFFRIYEGLLRDLPLVLGLPRATLVSSTVTPRTFEAVVDLPPSRSLAGRLRGRLRAFGSARAKLDRLQEQHEQLASNLASAQRNTQEVQDLFDGLPDLVVIHRAGTILWINRAVLTALGRHGELVGRPLLDIVDPTSHDIVRQRMTGAADSVTTGSVECWLLKSDRSRLLVEVSPSQVVRFEGAPARLIVGRDITERTRLQQQLLAADRMASIGMLAAGVAHEVNNPLAYVLNNIELATKALLPLGEATRPSREALAVALEGVAHIRIIVRDLLVLSRVDDHPLGPIDVRAVVESTLALAAKSIDDRARLICDYQRVPPAPGSVARLGQVLLNLVANALDSMHAASRDANELRVSVFSNPQGRVVIEVSDSGSGILPEHAARVFDPFFTTKPFGSGTGLGLAISQRLVGELGGELTFESVPLRGTTFRLVLAACD